MKKIIPEQNIRVRMAPSPTGALHVGTARTALFNYLFAKHYKGKFIMRIEDTDKERSKNKWEQNIIEGLNWLGIEWDEFYRQSERINIYKKYLEQLLKEKKAFYCWHSIEELEKEKIKQMANKEAPRHQCKYRDEEIDDKKLPAKSIIRFKNDAKEDIKFLDLIRGEVIFKPNTIGDFSIAKNIGKPLYNFAVVIDDYLMKISHIIRGEDHISNTPKQLLLINALNFTIVEFAHLPLVLGTDKSKLSKRHGHTSVHEYRDMGYLPETIFNFLALLGWHPKNDEREILSKEEIINEFDIKDVQKSGAVFDIEKLNWMNGMYIRNAKDTSNLINIVKKLLIDNNLIDNKVEQEFVEKIFELERSRIAKLSDIVDAVRFIFEDIRYDKELLIWKKSNEKETKEELEKLNVIIKSIEEKEWTKEKIEKILMPHAEAVGDRGKVLWPLRAALSGKKASPGPFEIIETLGKKETLKRIDTAINKLV